MFFIYIKQKELSILLEASYKFVSCCLKFHIQLFTCEFPTKIIFYKIFSLECEMAIGDRLRGQPILIYFNFY